MFIFNRNFWEYLGVFNCLIICMGYKESLIVIVDDMEDIGTLLEIKFKTEGFENIIFYSNPIFLLDDIRKGLKPRMVITDYGIPWVTGFQLLEILSLVDSCMKGIIITAEDGFLEDFKGPYPIIKKNIPNFCDITVSKVEIILKSQENY